MTFIHIVLEEATSEASTDVTKIVSSMGQYCRSLGKGIDIYAVVTQCLEKSRAIATQVSTMNPKLLMRSNVYVLALIRHSSPFDPIFPFSMFIQSITQMSFWMIV